MGRNSFGFVWYRNDNSGDVIWYDGKVGRKRFWIGWWKVD